VPNLLTTSHALWGDSAGQITGRPVGGTYQILTYGPKSRTRGGKKMKGYPVYIPGHVIETAAVRGYKGLGGAALDSHRRASRRGYSEKKWKARRVRKNSRRSSMRKNRRRSRRRSTRRSSRRRRSRRPRRNSRRRATRRNSRRRRSRAPRRNSRRRASRRRRSRRNPKYVVRNRRRRRRRVRKNQGIFGADLMKDVLTPVIGGTAGFVAARFLSNGVANIEAVRNILDKDKPAAEAENTKIAANVLGILATLGLAPKVKLIKDNQGALITGMGLALTDRLLGKVGGDMAGYLSGMGEYVSQPLGEYVSQPLGEYVSQPLGGLGGGVGAYAKLPAWSGYDYATAGMGETLYAAAGLGADPGNQALVDSAIDSAEGMTMAAAAGMGETLYAAAGLGAEADASLKSMYAKMQTPFASIYTPTDMARPVSDSMPFARPVPDSLYTPEGRGYAGGLFARNLFAGML
jgi:hypothetical protein